MTKERILVVEDEVLVAEELREDLEELGYSVAGVVGSGESAVRAVSENRPDLILMDVRLEGDVDGIEAARQIQAKFDVPIIYLTAYSDQETLKRAAATSPAAYLIKPFNERELEANIALALSANRPKPSPTDRLRGNEALVDALDFPALLLDAGGLIVYANLSALSFLKVGDLSFVRNESITRFVDIGTRESPDRPCLILATDGSASSAVVRIEELTLSNGDQIGALVLFQRMSGKERNFLESSACALNDAVLANLPASTSAGSGYEVRNFLYPCPSGTGDFHDVFHLGRDRFCFYALDVMGHGPLAALIAGTLRDIIRSTATKDVESGPAAILARVNRSYWERSFVPESFFVSLVLGVVERSSGRFALVRAGHPPCLCLRPGGRAEVLWAPGTAIGVSAELDVEERAGELEPGARLVLFSDGLIEAYAKGEGRLEAAVRRIAEIGDHPLEEFIEVLSADAREHFSGDDTSLLVIERCANP